MAVRNRSRGIIRQIRKRVKLKGSIDRARSSSLLLSLLVWSIDHDRAVNHRMQERCLRLRLSSSATLPNASSKSVVGAGRATSPVRVLR